MARIKIEMATATQLAVFATTHLGVPDVRPTLGLVRLQALIAQAWDKDYIEIPDPEEDPIQRRDPAMYKADGEDPFTRRRMCVVRISAEEKAGGDQPVPVAVAGKAMFIPRNKDCRVPYEYGEALLNANKHVFDTDQDSKIIGRREVPEYPATVMAEPEFGGWNLTSEERREAVTDGVLRLVEKGGKQVLEWTGQPQPIKKRAA